MEPNNFRIGASGDAAIRPTLNSVYNKDWGLSSTGAASIMQRGMYTLAGGVTTVYLATPLISAASAANIVFLFNSLTLNPVYFNGIISAQTFGSVLMSSISGFGVSGSGTDTGNWMVVGYQ